MSTGRSSVSTRPSSGARPMPPVGNSTTVSSLSRSIQSGSMNVTGNSIRQRPTSGTRQASTDRANIPSIQRRISTDTARSRLPNQDPSDEPNANNDESSNDRQKSHSPSPFQSRLQNGGLTGLQNLGNTCFMNSVLQCLSNTKPLLEFCFKDNLADVLNTSSTSVMKGVLIREYESLIRKMWTSSDGHSIASPSAFKSTVGRFAPRFLGYAQQDSQEFLRYLLQGLHEDVNRVQRKPTPIKIDEKAEERMNEKQLAKLSWERCLRYDNSDIADIFTGQLKSTLECTYCQYQSITFDMFWDLSIPLLRNKSSSSVQECIQLFMSKEELDGNEKPMCAKCKQKRRCMKKFSIQKCPEILVLHLKRFSQARSRAKLNTHVDFPITNLKLDDLADVMSDSYEGPVPSYNLIGVSYHSGTAYSGHYIARCKHPYTNQWHEFNDSSVYSINDKSRVVSSDAYVLFYERNN